VRLRWSGRILLVGQGELAADILGCTAGGFGGKLIVVDAVAVAVVWLASVWAVPLGLGEEGDGTYRVVIGMCCYALFLEAM
jgi:hypothetical protein